MDKDDFKLLQVGTRVCCRGGESKVAGTVTARQQTQTKLIIHVLWDDGEKTVWEYKPEVGETTDPIWEWDEVGVRWLLRPDEGMSLSAEEFRDLLRRAGNRQVGVELMLDPYPIRGVVVDANGVAHLNIETGTPMSADQVLQLTQNATAIVLASVDSPEASCKLKRECYATQVGEEIVVCFNAGWGPLWQQNRTPTHAAAADVHPMWHEE